MLSSPRRATAGASFGSRPAGRPRQTPAFGAAPGSARPITDLVGVDAGATSALKTAGVETVSDLWAHAGDRSGRGTLSGTTGIPMDRLAEWARRADLMRVGEIGPRHAVLLEAAGVTSLRLLRLRSSRSLHSRLVEVNRTAKVVEVVPTVETIARWIRLADRFGS